MEKELFYEKEENPFAMAWDKFSFAYFSSINRCSIQMMTILMGLSRINKKNKILDVGCGPGLGTKLLTFDIPNYTSCIYAVDFSKEMLSLASGVFSDFEDFNANHHNHWEVLDYEPQNKINIDADLEILRNSGKIGKIVKFLPGNIKNLNFEDSQFDVYISNYCLMLSQDVDKSIQESFRVLKTDGVAAFSIWGKKHESKLGYFLFEEILKRFGVEVEHKINHFALGEDPESLKQKFFDAGFKEVRIEYSTMIYDCYDEQDFLEKFQGTQVNSILKNIKTNGGIVKEILETVKNEARKHVVENKELPTLNSMIIIAFK